MNKFKKKGFGDVASTLIMFIAVISVTTGVVILFKNYMVDTQQSFTVQNDITSNKLKTALSVSNVYYNSTSQDLFVYIKNIGQTNLQSRFFDYFVNDIYIDLNNTDIVYASNQSQDISMVPPLETFVVIYNINLPAGTNSVRLATEFGVSISESFNI